jgi:hypothetical protein
MVMGVFTECPTSKQVSRVEVIFEGTLMID